MPWLWIQKLCVGAIMLVVEFVKHDAFRESSQVRQSPTFWFLKAQAGASQFKKSSLRVACVVSVNAFRQQTFPTALPPARKSGAAAPCSHTCAKTVLAFTRSLRWLISAFHNREPVRLRSESGYTRDTASIVNDTAQERL